MARLRWAAIAVLASITLAACSGGGKSPTTASGQVADPTTTTAPSAPVAKSFDDISKAIITAVPAGYAVQPDSVDDTGPSDLAKAISDDGGEDAGAVFTRDHFLRGYQREWDQTVDDQIVVYVYQFADHAGAVDYTKRATADAGAQTEGVSIGLFDVPGIAGAVGENGSDPSFATATVSFVKGPYSVQVVVNNDSAQGLQALVSQLALDQYSRL